MKRHPAHQPGQPTTPLRSTKATTANPKGPLAAQASAGDTKPPEILDGGVRPPGENGPGTLPGTHSSPPTVPAPPPPAGHGSPAPAPSPPPAQPAPLPSTGSRPYALRVRGVVAADLPAELRGRWAAVRARAPGRTREADAGAQRLVRTGRGGGGRLQAGVWSRREVRGPTAGAYMAALGGSGERNGVLALWILARALGYGWRMAARWARQRLGRLPVAVVAGWAEGLRPARAREVVLAWCASRARAPGTMGLLPKASSKQGWTWTLGGERWRFADVVSWPLPAGLESALCGCGGCAEDGSEVHGGRAWARFLEEERAKRRAARADELTGGAVLGRAAEGEHWGAGACVGCGRLVLAGATTCGVCDGQP